MLGSRVRLAVRPSDDVTLIFFEAGGEVVGGREGVETGWRGLFGATCGQEY